MDQQAFEQRLAAARQHVRRRCLAYQIAWNDQRIELDKRALRRFLIVAAIVAGAILLTAAVLCAPAILDEIHACMNEMGGVNR